MLGAGSLGASSEVFALRITAPPAPAVGDDDKHHPGESGAKSSRRFSGAEKTCVFALRLLLSDRDSTYKLLELRHRVFVLHATAAAT